MFHRGVPLESSAERFRKNSSRKTSAVFPGATPLSVPPGVSARIISEAPLEFPPEILQELSPEVLFGVRLEDLQDFPEVPTERFLLYDFLWMFL